MIRNKLTHILFLVIIISSFTACNNNCDRTNLNYDFNYLDSKINTWIAQQFYDGASIIITKNDTIIHEKYFGNYTPETEVYVASCGKWVAAAVIASVVDEGKLSWDDPVSKWLPEFTDVKGTATLRQLLSHTSGYPDYQPKGAHPDDYQSLEEAVSQIVNLPADTTPGAVFHYGGLAMQVAGRMAELATGADWEMLFELKIAGPLQMTDSRFVPVDTTPGHNPMLGGGLKTTLHDYAHFLEMMSNNGVYKGRRVLSEIVISEMQSDQIRGAFINEPEYVQKVRGTSNNSIYGLGEWREELDTAGAPVLISSPGWAGAYPWIDKTNDTWGFFLAHVNVGRANNNDFFSFYSSPVLPLMVRNIFSKAGMPDSVKKGYITVNGATLYYEECGKGEPLIFIHGHSFDNSEWDPQFMEFARHFRAIRYDCRGYGRSSKPIEGKEFMHVNDLIGLMDSLHIDKAHVVGLSMGGFIVTDMLALYQNRILTATAASGDIFPVPGPSRPWTQEGIANRKKEISLLKERGIYNLKLDWYNALIHNGAGNDPQVHRKIWNMIARWDMWQPLHIEPRLVLGNDAVDLLKKQRIHVPVLVLTGQVDAKNPDKLLECIPEAKQVIIPNAGHVSNLENPEGFIYAVLNFIEHNYSE